MSSGNNKTRSYLEEQNAEKNSKRRERYKQMPSVEKEALLLNRRLRRQNSAATTLSSDCDTLPTRKKGLIIRDSPAATQTTTALRQVSDESPVVHKDKTPACFYSFEKGSTSTTAEKAERTASDTNTVVGLIRDAKLIVWDEVSMAKKKMLEVFDLLLKDLMDTNKLFGGKVVVFGGDFRQTLPVVRNGKKEDFINESLLYSTIWNELEKLQLSENMRAKADPAFCDYLLKIGNGQEQVNSTNKIEFPHSLIIPFTTEKESLDKLFRVTYPNLNSLCSNSSYTDSRVILTTKNDYVNEINDMLIDQFPGKSKTFIGIDETIDFSNQTQFEELLHTLNPASLPAYKLTLKENCPIMLLRNLNPYEGLCNGTRLNCCDFKTHVISAKITTGDFKNTHVFIPRIPLLSSQDEKSPVPFKRTQFPIRLCFAMTINKAQGQTLDFVGIYLREPVFSHGQLYVALSRAKSLNSVKLLIRPPTQNCHDDHSSYNIVYDEII